MQQKPLNPFGITKAVDLDDEQIQSLWVDVSGDAQELAEYTRPLSPMPTFILGAKGSGKTHLMRYHSFEVQTLRHREQGLSSREGVERDRYLGIYVRCSGLNSGRFSGKRQTDEVWRELFAYYIELWLAQHLLHVAESLVRCAGDSGEQEFCADVVRLFDKSPSSAMANVSALLNYIADQQRHLDFEVNNCVFTGSVNVEILATRGRLVFGIPKLLAKHYAFLRDVLFVYSIDEFENLTIEQQKLINTLVREKELPSTLRIGARLYGVKTSATDSADEENLKDSEFEILPLDKVFRTHRRRYNEFAQQLIEKRLTAALGLLTEQRAVEASQINWDIFFESSNEAWNSESFFELVGTEPSGNRRHFQQLREKLTAVSLDKRAIEEIVARLSVERYPLLEKVNLLLLFQDMHKGKSPFASSKEIAGLCASFLQDQKKKSRFVTNLEHFKSDLVAQLRRENDSKQYYLGLDNFIVMSAGLPRALLTILRSVFEWSFFNGEDPLQSHRISISAQQRGAKDASDWFYENMRKAGDDGLAIQTAIDRLARLFRVNHFADKPIECSLITFSVPEQDADDEALRILRLAESRSFVIPISGGQRDKNSERVVAKFQINNMLAPRWDLPLGRRGAVSLSAKHFNAIFNRNKSAEFDRLLSDWREKMTAPRFGKTEVGDGRAQRDLF